MGLRGWAQLLFSLCVSRSLSPSPFLSLSLSLGVEDEVSRRRRRKGGRWGQRASPFGSHIALSALPFFFLFPLFLPVSQDTKNAVRKNERAREGGRVREESAEPQRFLRTRPPVSLRSLLSSPLRLLSLSLSCFAGLPLCDACPWVWPAARWASTRLQRTGSS